MAKTQVKAASPFTKEGMRARFSELKTQLEAIDAELLPLQEEQAEIANYRREREVELNTLLKEKNLERGDITNEMAIISRALSGQTSEPEAELTEETSSE